MTITYINLLHLNFTKKAGKMRFLVNPFGQIALHYVVLLNIVDAQTYNQDIRIDPAQFRIPEVINGNGERLFGIPEPQDNPSRGQVPIRLLRSRYQIQLKKPVNSRKYNQNFGVNVAGLLFFYHLIHFNFYKNYYPLTTPFILRTKRFLRPTNPLDCLHRRLPI